MTLRESIIVPGLAHGRLPIPTASKVGPLVHSGGILGMDPASREIPDSLVAQCRLMFENVARVMQAAGGSTGNIVKMTVWMADKSARDLLNEEWLKMFPDEASRPARHTLEHPGFRPPVKIQCEVMGWVG